MDRQKLEDSLASAERRVSDCKRHIEEQRVRMALAELKGRLDARSEGMLQLYMDNEALFEAHLDRIRDEIRKQSESP